MPSSLPIALDGASCLSPGDRSRRVLGAVPPALPRGAALLLRVDEDGLLPTVRDGLVEGAPDPGHLVHSCLGRSLRADGEFVGVMTVAAVPAWRSPLTASAGSCPGPR